ncbi:hypothetical protein GCM10023211_05690 [Orbus sasakiae]|uniref:Uncharacterized protein n=1 Tax=Orbus sasakiae TaxID=1078475 RepID=A0ABP9N0H1_9GAMM
MSAKYRYLIKECIIKKIIVLVLITTLCLTDAAMADGFNNGTIQQFNSCYIGQTQAEITIEQAKQMPVIYNDMLLNKW